MGWERRGWLDETPSVSLLGVVYLLFCADGAGEVVTDSLGALTFTILWMVRLLKVRMSRI